MDEPRCPGCHHHLPLHTLDCDMSCGTCRTPFGGHVVGCPEVTAPKPHDWWCCDGAPERAILTDLIAELRVFHQREGLLDYCRLCSDDEWVARWPCDSAKALDRAEARLREVSGDE